MNKFLLLLSSVLLVGGGYTYVQGKNIHSPSYNKLESTQLVSSPIPSAPSQRARKVAADVYILLDYDRKQSYI